ncbi:hypothetical protein HPB50_019291 [Hyalomma asiaticum]|uniref:Uncharacterized protein n=1 Tax=Hyalomma asiaticum TaxID=266040 RepID=A0ACB7TL08_HYAAI|nr:hypothetical protein HPB50_019291 [Hyalomma asiaticum]
MSVTPEHYTATLCQKDRERYEDEKLRTGHIHASCGRLCERRGLVAARRQLRYPRISRSEDEFYYPGAAHVQKGPRGPQLCDEWLGAGAAGEESHR